MASEFIGHLILVTLSSPPNAQVRGVVSDVANQRLFLTDVTLLWSNQRLPAFTIDSALIIDLELSPQARENTLSEHGRQVSAERPLRPRHDNIAPIPNQQAFQDPAILSFSKPHPVLSSRPLNTNAHIPVEIISPVMIADGAVPSPASTNKPSHPGAGQSSISSIATALPIQVVNRKDSSATATLTEPFDVVGGEAHSPQVKVGKRTRRKENRVKEALSQAAPGVVNANDYNPSLESSGKKQGRGRGWRQTPLVEEIPVKANGTGKKSRHKSRKSILEDLNGWATEEATDIQDMGEFDFEGNLSKFDKKTVFDDIRRDDTIPSDERLVSFNRKAKPGTNGGRNLHYTENVLGEDTEEDNRDEKHYSSGKASKRAGSNRPPPSRKGSAFPGTLNIRTESPYPLTRTTTTASPINGSIAGVGTRATFRLFESNRPCPTISPLQMLELEQLCTTDLGLTEDMLSENAGRGIAETVLKVGGHRKPVLFLVGNHKSGGRAVAAARHLRNRRMRVTVCVLGGEREDMLLETLRKQLAIYKKGGGFVDKWDQLQVKMSTGDHMPGIVVDALLGVHVAFDELRTDDQAAAYEMIKWANRYSMSPADLRVISVDVPSGLSASSGDITEIDGEILAMTAHYVVAFGAPKIGLLNVMAGMPDEWQIWVADIGISATAWQKHGSRRRHGVDFESNWVVRVKYAPGTATM